MNSTNLNRYNGKEWIDDWIPNQWPQNGGKGCGTNKVGSAYSMIIEWIKMKCVDPMLKLPSLDLVNKISENGRNIYESNPINQTILEIDFDWTFWNEPGSSTFWRFGISKYYQYSICRNTCQCHYMRILETTINRSYWC